MRKLSKHAQKNQKQLYKLEVTRKTLEISIKYSVQNTIHSDDRRQNS